MIRLCPSLLVSLLGLLFVIAGPVGTSSAASIPFDPPPNFREGEAFIAANGGEKCEAVGIPVQWDVECGIGASYNGQSAVYNGGAAAGFCHAHHEAQTEYHPAPTIDFYQCVFSYSLPGGSEFTPVAVCQFENRDGAGPSTGWTREAYGQRSTVATLLECLGDARPDLPVAQCDAYWVKPGGHLKVPAPGVLGNDFDPNDLKLTVAADKLNFGVRDHPYRLEQTGELRFTPGATPGGKPFKAEITYHATNSRGLPSPPATISIYIQPTKPSAAKLKGCGEGDRHTAAGQACTLKPRFKKPIHKEINGGYFRIKGPSVDQLHMSWDGSVSWCSNGRDVQVLFAEGYFSTDEGTPSVAGALLQAAYAGGQALWGTVTGRVRWKPLETPVTRVRALPGNPLSHAFEIKSFTGTLQSCIDPLSLLFTGGKVVKVASKAIKSRAAFEALDQAARASKLRAVEHAYTAVIAKVASKLRADLQPQLKNRYLSEGPSRSEVEYYKGSITVKGKRGKSETKPLKVGNQLGKKAAQELARREARRQAEVVQRTALAQLKAAIARLIDGATNLLCFDVWKPSFDVHLTAGLRPETDFHLFGSDEPSVYNKWVAESTP